MTSSSAPDSSEPTPGGRTRPEGVRVVLLGVLTVALLASAVVVVLLASQRRGEADDVQSRREAVMAQAEQFMLRVNTYGPDLLDEQNQMPKYRSLVSEVITSKFRTDFEKNVPAAESTVANGLARTSKVYGTGVSTIDDDSATALVAGSFTDSYPKKAGSEDRVSVDPVPFRVEVSLVKVDGKWLVDDFTPITGEDPRPGGVPGTPAPSGSTEGDPGATPAPTGEPTP